MAIRAGAGPSRLSSKPRDLTSPALTEARALEWSRSGVVAWADFQSGVRAWSDLSGEPVDLGTDINSAEVLAFHPAGRRLAVSDSSSIHILDVQRGRSERSLEGPPTTRTGIAFRPDGTRVAFASSEGLRCLTTGSASKCGWRHSSNTRAPSTSRSAPMGDGSQPVSGDLSRQLRSGPVPAPVIP